MQFKALGLVASATLLAAAGCSSGGGGGGGGGNTVNALVAPINLSETGDPGSAVSIGATTATTATYSYDEEDESVTVSWAAGPHAGTSRRYEEVSAGLYNLESAGEQGSLLVFQPNDDVIIAVGGVTPNNSNTAATGIVFGGTTPSSVPASGTVTYQANDGVLIGNMVVDDNVCPELGCWGDVNIAANFSDGSVAGTFSNFGNGVENIGFNGSMGSLKTTYSGSSFTYGGTETSGKLYGGFFGEDGMETAGIFDVGTGATRFAGGFAATAVPPP